MMSEIATFFFVSHIHKRLIHKNVTKQVLVVEAEILCKFTWSVNGVKHPEADFIFH